MNDTFQAKTQYKEEDVRVPNKNEIPLEERLKFDWSNVTTGMTEEAKNTILRVLEYRLFFNKPMPIQSRVIPELVAGFDVAAQAQTGSGKTLAFLIPIIHNIMNIPNRNDYTLYSIIVVPSRELALQIQSAFAPFEEETKIKSALVTGGTKDLTKVRMEKKRNFFCNLLIGTPGRITSYIKNNIIDTSNVRSLILDEADRLLELGFKKQIDYILENTPKDRLTGIFSATIENTPLKDLIRAGLKENRKEIILTAKEVPPTPTDNYYIVMNYEDRISYLLEFLRDHVGEKIIIFFATSEIVKFYSKLISTIANDPNYYPQVDDIVIYTLYGNMNYKERVKVYKEFVHAKEGVLLTTDLSSRGLDFQKVNWSIMFNITNDPKSYIHRAGRSARAGEEGASLIYLHPYEVDFYLKKLKDIGVELDDVTESMKDYTPFRLKAFYKAIKKTAPALQKQGRMAYKSCVRYYRIFEGQLPFEVMNKISESMAASFEVCRPLNVRKFDVLAKRREERKEEKLRKKMEAKRKREEEQKSKKEGEEEELKNENTKEAEENDSKRRKME